MEPKNLHFGGGVAATVLNPIVLAIVLAAGVMIVVWPRVKTIAPFIATAILIPGDQVLVIGGLHFPMMRLLALFGIVRLIREKASSKGPIFGRGFNNIDYAVLGYAISVAVAGVFLFREMGAVIFQFGNLYTAFGLYLLLRWMIRDKKDISRMIRTLAWITPAIAASMAIELATGHSPFAMLGGARADWYGNLMERDGHFRALGCFGHPILAGTYGAIVLPLFVLLWREERKHLLPGMAIASTAVIIVTSNSSTPILAYLGGVLALCLWPIRNWMRAIRWGVAVSLVSIHLVWKKPVWYLIAKVDISGGSSSWHRFNLIDQCVRHFGDWWLIGVKSSADWGWDMWDTANQYVATCNYSGLLAFILFISILVYGFKYLGRARRRVPDKAQRFSLWALGASLFANVVAFVGISYWDQTVVVWYALLAAIAAATVTKPERVHAISKDVDQSTQFVPHAEIAADKVDSPIGTASEGFVAS